MKYKGKAISGSSLLTIIGVICFATIVVTAVVVTSNALTFGGTTVNPASIVLTDSGGDTTSVTVGDPAVYNFNANVASALTSGATWTVNIQKTGIVVGDITSATININSAGAHAFGTFTVVDANNIHATYVPGTQAASPTIPCVVTIIYANTGAYVVSVTLTGNTA